MIYHVLWAVISIGDEKLVDGFAHRSNLLFDTRNKPRKAGFVALAGLHGPVADPAHRGALSCLPSVR